MNTVFEVRTGAIDEIVAFLRGALGDRVNTTRAVREQHARGEALDIQLPADVVAWPRDKHEVSAILARCNSLGVPVIAYGAGSSLEGHVSAPFGGVCLDMSLMNSLITVHAEDGDCVVQPGITREDGAHLVLVARPGDDVGGQLDVERFAAGVLLAHRAGGVDAVAERAAQEGDDLVDRARRDFEDGVHGGLRRPCARAWPRP